MNVTTLLKRSVTSDKICCFIPGFNIYFDAIDQEQARLKSKALTHHFLDYYLLKDDIADFSKGLRALNKALRDRGFVPQNSNSVTMKILSGQPVNAIYDNKSMLVPMAFANNSQSFETRSELCV